MFKESMGDIKIQGIGGLEGHVILNLCSFMQKCSQLINKFKIFVKSLIA